MRLIILPVTGFIIGLIADMPAFLYGNGSYGVYIGVILLLFTIISFLTLSEKTSVLAYFPAGIYLISVVLSYGYLSHYTGLAPPLKANSLGIVAIAIALEIFSAIINNLYRAARAYLMELSNSGYEIEEANESISRYSNRILTSGVLAFLASLFVVTLITSSTFINIGGLLPALLLLIVTYVVITRFIFARGRES